MPNLTPNRTRSISCKPLTFAAPLALALCGGSLVGCSASSAKFDQKFALDGEVSEWPKDRVAIATGDYLYLRFRLGDDQNPESLHALLDVDGNGQTGIAIGDLQAVVDSGAILPPSIASLGIEIDVRVTPSSNGMPEVVMTGYEPDLRPVDLASAGVVFDIASVGTRGWYELRIERWGDANWPLAKAGTLRGVYLSFAEGVLVGASDPAFDVKMPAGATTAPNADMLEITPPQEAPAEAPQS